MTEKNTGLWVALVAVAIIAIIALVVGFNASAAKSTSFGGVTNYDELDATAIKIGGTNGSRVGPLVISTCSLIAASFTVTASTTVPMDCSVPGIVKGDVVIAGFATSSASVAGWDIVGASASTTSGFITLDISNGLGANSLIPASLASTTQIIVAHPRSTVPGL